VCFQLQSFILHHNLLSWRGSGNRTIAFTVHKHRSKCIFTLLFHIVVTIGFAQTNESVAEDVGIVSVHAIIISGTLERELCVVISPVPGSALGMVLYICEKM